MLSDLLALLLKLAMFAFSSIVTGARALWNGVSPDALREPVVFVANHRSHGDFALLWTVLPAALRQRTRPVVGADYWRATWLRRLISERVLRAVLIERDSTANQADRDKPIQQMQEALAAGDSLIVFPEGTRNLSDDTLLPLKSGLFHLALKSPSVNFVPAWIDNLHRVMPKGEVIPLPLLCTVRFGAPFRWIEGQDKASFLTSMREAMLALHQQSGKT
jgi:1-acyl-sn-glycerol-3-phosphate acyltransferase